MKQVLLVFLGGGLGSALRYLVSLYLNPVFSLFYLGTFGVNILGSLIIGVLFGYTTTSASVSPHLMLLLATGFCGGFTTFSAFSLESQTLLKSGEVFYFILYIAASILTGILAVIAGIWLGKHLLS